MSLVLWSRRSSTRPTQDATSSVSVSPPPYIPGSYEDCASSESRKKFYYVPPPAYFYIRKLAPYPDQIRHLHPFTLEYTSPELEDPSKFDMLKALFPSRSLSCIDPRLWATLVQIYPSTLPDWLHVYDIPLSDIHVPLLQTITPTSTCSIVTVLDLPGCPELDDDTILVLKALTGLVALDASMTSLTSWGVSQLALCCRTEGEISSRKGPWALRILRLTGSKGIDFRVFKDLYRFKGLCVLDLRDTSIVPSKIPEPYSTSLWSLSHSSGSGFDGPTLHSLYHPNPLHDSLHALLKLSELPVLSSQVHSQGPSRPESNTIFSSSSVYQLHIDRLNHVPQGTDYIRLSRTTSSSNVKLEDTAVTFSPVTHLGSSSNPRSTAPSSTSFSIQYQCPKQYAGPDEPLSHRRFSSRRDPDEEQWMDSVATEELDAHNSNMAALRFHTKSLSTRHLTPLSRISYPSGDSAEFGDQINLSDSGYSAWRYYDDDREREWRQKRVKIPVSTSALPPITAAHKRINRTKSSKNPKNLSEVVIDFDPLMLYRIPPSWTELVATTEQQGGSSPASVPVSSSRSSSFSGPSNSTMPVSGSGTENAGPEFFHILPHHHDTHSKPKTTTASVRNTEKTQVMLERQREAVSKRRRVDASESSIPAVPRRSGSGSGGSFLNPSAKASINPFKSTTLSTFSGFIGSTNDKASRRAGYVDARKAIEMPVSSFSTGSSGENGSKNGARNQVTETRTGTEIGKDNNNNGNRYNLHSKDAEKSSNRLDLNVTGASTSTSAHRFVPTITDTELISDTAMSRRSSPVGRVITAYPLNASSKSSSASFDPSSAFWGDSALDPAFFGSTSNAPSTSLSTSPTSTHPQVRYVDGTQMNGLSGTGKRLKPISTIRVPELPEEERKKLKARVSMESIPSATTGTTTSGSTVSLKAGGRSSRRKSSPTGAAEKRNQAGGGGGRLSGDIRAFMIRKNTGSNSSGSGESSRKNRKSE